MKILCKIGFICACSLFFSIANANTFIEKKINDKTIRVIEYDLSSKEYDIHSAYTPDPTSERDLMVENNGVTAINAAFFCPADYKECGGKTFTINEHYKDGEKVSGIYDTTGDRVVFGWDKNKVPLLYQTDKINAGKESDIYEGFANHPLILKDGENMLESWYDSFLVDMKMKDSSLKNFVCNDKDKKHIYFGVVYDVTLDDLVPILSQLGCYDALNLDAGKSTAFVYNGRYILGPQRPILDGIVIERKGLDIRKIDKIAKDAVEKVMIPISKRTREKKISLLNKVSEQLTNLRVKIYEKLSVDTIDENGVVNGYKIEIKDLNTLKKVYYINSLNFYISKKIKSL